MNREELKKELANIQHEQWSGWMLYLFSFGTFNEDGSFTIDEDKVKRWKRQTRTPYSELTDKEQQSDQIEAEKIMTLFDQYSNSRIREYIAPHLEICRQRNGLSYCKNCSLAELEQSKESDE